MTCQTEGDVKSNEKGSDGRKKPDQFRDSFNTRSTGTPIRGGHKKTKSVFFSSQFFRKRENCFIPSSYSSNLPAPFYSRTRGEIAMRILRLTLEVVTMGKCFFLSQAALALCKHHSSPSIFLLSADLFLSGVHSFLDGQDLPFWTMSSDFDSIFLLSITVTKLEEKHCSFKIIFLLTQI